MMARIEPGATGADHYVVVDTPLGALFVAFGDRGLTRIAPTGRSGPDPAAFERGYELRFGRRLRRAAAPPAGLLTAIRDGSPGPVPVDLTGVSAFTRAVLGVTTTIPSGEVRTYAWVAAEVGRPRAVRAVGSALARNPLPVVIPCHRVVRSDGRVGEYALGVELKRALLEREGLDLGGLAGPGPRRRLPAPAV